MALIESSSYYERERLDKEAQDKHREKVHNIEHIVNMFPIYGLLEDLYKSLNQDYVQFGGVHPSYRYDVDDFIGIKGSASKIDYGKKLDKIELTSYGSIGHTMFIEMIRTKLAEKDPSYHYHVGVSYDARKLDNGRICNDSKELKLSVTATPKSEHSEPTPLLEPQVAVMPQTTPIAEPIQNPETPQNNISTAGLLNNESLSIRNEKSAEMQRIVEYFRQYHSDQLVQEIVDDMNKRYKNDPTRSNQFSGFTFFSDDGSVGLENLSLFRSDSEGYDLFTAMVIEQMNARDPSYSYSIPLFSYGDSTELPNDRGPERCCPHFQICVIAEPKPAIEAQTPRPVKEVKTLNPEPSQTETATPTDNTNYWDNEDNYRLDLDRRFEDYPSIPPQELIEEELDSYDAVLEFDREYHPELRVSDDAAYWDATNVVHYGAAKRYRSTHDHLLERAMGLQPGQLVYAPDAPQID